MNNKKIIEVIGLVVFLLILLFVSLFLTQKIKTNKNINTLNNNEPIQTKEELNSSNVFVPSSKEEAQNLGENVAKPQNVVQANPKTDASIRTFEGLLIENNEFKPLEFRVKQGDIFDVFVKALDKDYDITQPDYGIVLNIKKGEEKRLQFQATASGKFMFYCSLCGGPDKGPKGYLIVVPK
jgi:nitrous oxide reductase